MLATTINMTGIIPSIVQLKFANWTIPDFSRILPTVVMIVVEETADLLKQSCCIQGDQNLIIIKLRAKYTCFVTQQLSKREFIILRSSKIISPANCKLFTLIFCKSEHKMAAWL